MASIAAPDGSIVERRQHKRESGVKSYFEDLDASVGLGRLARRGGAASVASVYGNGVLQIVSTIVLARLLTPEDFGLVAIVLVLTRFTPLLIDLGLGDATTQKNHITTNQISTLFWLSSGIGIAIAMVLAMCSPLIAWLYREPRLQSVTLVFAAAWVFVGLSSQHMSLLRRAMKFVVIARIQFLGALVGVTVAIVIAICGYGYWALVLRPVVTSACIAAGTWMACRWRPGFPVFDTEVRSMLRFGINVLSFSIINSVIGVADRIALSLYYPPSNVGLYQNSWNLFENAILFPFQHLHGVGSAGLSRLRSDPAALRQKYEATLSALAFFVMPAAAILSVTGQDAVVLLLGEKWRQSGFLLSIITLWGIVAFIETSQGWLHVSSGRAERWKNWGVVSILARAAAILVGLPFGVNGLAIALVVVGWLIAFPTISYAGRPLGIGAALAIRAVGGPLLGAIIACATGWWLRIAFFTQFASLSRLFLLTFLCGSIYLLIVVGLFRVTKPIGVARKLAQDFGLTWGRRVA
jgi:O-antigen/teichoic acid export membrane protein